MLKILASADYHLGMKFAGYPNIQEQLAEARFASLQRLVDTANESGCELFLIAGDLFDRVSVSARDVIRAAQLLNGFQGRLAAVLPGNHDFYSGRSSSLWSRFREAAGDRLLLLTDPGVYDLTHYDLKILLYAGPCDSKHSKDNTISWLKNADQAKTEAQGYGECLRIGVAHGSVEGVSPDAQGVYFPMTRKQLEKAPVDLWVIGHTHRQHPGEAGSLGTGTDSPAQVLIPGTPEPDGFDCRHEGKAWMIETDENHRVRLQSVSTGIYRFVREEKTLESPLDIQRLADLLRGARLRGARPEAVDRSRTLLRLTLRGRLKADQLAELRGHLVEAEDSYLYTQIDDSRLLEVISEQTVEAEYTEGSFPYRLLKQLIAAQDFEALQTAYTLLQEQKK
jgi:DNA repair exonuclease SbcCD nuclease subunit